MSDFAIADVGSKKRMYTGRLNRVYNFDVHERPTKSSHPSLFISSIAEHPAPMNEGSINTPIRSTEDPEATQSSGQPPSRDSQSLNGTEPSSQQSGASEDVGPVQAAQYWICEHDIHGRWFKFGDIGENEFFQHDPQFRITLPLKHFDTETQTVSYVTFKTFEQLRQALDLAKTVTQKQHTLDIIERFNKECPDERSMPNYDPPES